MGRRRGRGRGQGNRGRKSGRAKGSVGGGSKGKGKSKGGASSGRRGGQGNRGRTSTSRNAASNKGNRGGTSKGTSTGRKGGQGNKGKFGRAKGYSVKSVAKSIGKGLSTAGKVSRQFKQPVTSLSSLAIRSILNNPAVARGIAQYGANTFGAQNQRTRDMSKLSPQQQRKYQRLSEKTGRDYSIRKPTFRLNLNMRDIAKFAGLDKNKYYNKFTTPAIRNAQINKQFYGNPMKKGWHSSQRTGRGQGLTDKQRVLAERIARSSHPEFVHSRREAAGLPSLRIGPKPLPRMGPQQDWLSQLYSSHNINKGQLDQGARDYWTNEAKTKGRDAVMKSIIGTSKAQGTYGGRKKPRLISTGSRPKPAWWKARFAGSGHGHSKPRRGGGGTFALGPALSAGIGLLGSVTRSKDAKRKAKSQNKLTEKKFVKSLAKHMAATRGI